MPIFMGILRTLILETFRKWTSSREDSHAKTSALLEKELASRGVVLHSGNITSKPLGYYDQNSHSLRMFQHSLIGDSTLFLQTLPKSGMMWNGIIYRLPQLVHFTKGRGFLYWLTPTLVQRWSKDRIIITKNGTPRRLYKNNKTSSLGLESQVRMFPTPRVADTQGSKIPIIVGTNTRISKKGIKAGAKLSNIYGTGRLNPNWVEWLMGFPIGWTELDVSETQSFLNVRKSLRKQSKLT